jgi:hypothetical protein
MTPETPVPGPGKSDRIQIIGFVPFAGNTRHSVMDRQLLTILGAAGDSVNVVTCRGLMRAACPVIRGSGATSAPGIHRTCRNCRSSASELWRGTGFINHSLDDYTTLADNSVADEVVETQVSSPDVPVIFEGVDFSSLSRYSLLLWNKTPQIRPGTPQWIDFLGQLHTSIRVYLAARRLVAQVVNGNELPAFALARNGFHPNAAAFLEGAQESGATPVRFDGGLHSRSQDVSIFLSSRRDFVELRTSERAARASSTPSLTRDRAEAVLAHLFDLQFGRTPLAYSTGMSGVSPGRTLETLGIPEGSPVAIALTSSEDEVRAARDVGAYVESDEPLLSQIEWLETIVGQARGSEAFIVIRVHPRLAPSARFPTEAPQMREIEALVRKARLDNVILDLPSEGRPISSLIQIADVCVNHQSTAGLEFVTHGVPLSHLQPSACPSYPANVISSGPEWLAVLERSRSDAGQSEMLTKLIWTLRWWSGLLLDEPLLLTGKEVDLNVLHRPATATSTELRQPRRFLPPTSSRLRSVTRFAAFNPLRRRRIRASISAVDQRSSGMDAREVRSALLERALPNDRASWQLLRFPVPSPSPEEIEEARWFLSEVLSWYTADLQESRVMSYWRHWSEDPNR